MCAFQLLNLINILTKKKWIFSMLNWMVLFSFFPRRHGLTCAKLWENIMSLGICGQWRPRSDCASAQSDLGLHCPLTESLTTIECMNTELRLRWYFTHVQDVLNLCILPMFEGTFLLKDKWNVNPYFLGEKKEKHCSSNFNCRTLKIEMRAGLRKPDNSPR